MSQQVHERFDLRVFALGPKWNGVELLDLPYPVTPHFTPLQQKIWFNTAIGVEVEIEQVGRMACHGWEWKLDGSLRNSGMEFVTEYGCRVWNFPQRIANLHKTLNKHFPHREYTERTSVHVHLDVRRFDELQLANLLILYTLLEDPLFALCPPHRRENIFCVPIRESMGLPIFDIWKYVDGYQKYTALNLLCLPAFGTVEFRHQHGTDQPNALIPWVLLLSLIKMVAQTIDHEQLKGMVSGLKMSSQYDTFLQTLFGPWAAMIRRSSSLDLSVSDAKFFFNATKDIIPCAD